VRVAAVQPGNSECHLEFFDRLIEQFHILVGKSEAEMHFEVHQRSKVAGRTFQFFKDGLELISRWSSLNHRRGCSDWWMRVGDQPAHGVKLAQGFARALG